MKSNEVKFILNYPSKIVFGRGSFEKLPEFVPENARILLVTGKSAKKSGLFEKTTRILKDFHIAGTSEADAELPLKCLQSVVAAGRESNAEAVIAVGGGSVIDAGKAAAAIIPADGNAADYFYGEKNLLRKGLFFLAAPTTSGSGAEITNNSVVRDTESNIKQSIRHPLMVADFAVIDPLLTVSAPPELTACSGMDALVQAVESYTSVNANPVTKTLAKKAVGIIFRNIFPAYSDGENLDARENMAQGSLMSAMAFSQSGLGAVHGLAHPIGSLLKIPHGFTCSVLLEYIMKWNLPVCGRLYEELGAECGFRNAEDFIGSLSMLSAKMNIPKNFSGCGLDKSHFGFIIKNCRSKSMRHNSRPMTDADVEELLIQLL